MATENSKVEIGIAKALVASYAENVGHSWSTQITFAVSPRSR